MSSELLLISSPRPLTCIQELDLLHRLISLTSALLASTCWAFLGLEVFALARFSVGKDCLTFDLVGEANISLGTTIPLELSLIAWTVVCLRHDVEIFSLEFLISSRLLLYVLTKVRQSIGS